MNFPCYEKGQLIAGDASAIAVALNGTPGRVMNAKDVLLWNPGPLDVTVLCGGSDAVADPSCAALPARAQWIYGKGAGTHLSVYSPNGTQNITAILGQGS